MTLVFKFNVVCREFSYNGRHGEIVVVHFARERLNAASAVAEDDDLIHTDDTIEVAEYVKLPFL